MYMFVYVCVCMYMYVYVCIYSCIYICMYIYIYTCLCVYIFIIYANNKGASFEMNPSKPRPLCQGLGLDAQLYVFYL